MSENRNRIQKRKSKINIISVTIFIMIILADLVIVANYSQIVVKNKKISTMDAIAKSFEVAGQKPFAVDISNKKIQKEFIETQKILFLAYVMLILLYISKNIGLRKDFKGIEHGSATWGSKSDVKKFSNRKRIVLSNELFLDPESKIPDNLNELLIGGSGAGKSFRKIKPDIMNMNGSFVITDLKGELVKDCYKVLSENGYKIRILNLLQPRYSNGYNPFRYIDLYKEGTLESDVLSLATTFMKNTADNKKGGGDQFWDDAMKALLIAFIFYLVLERPENERNFENVYNLVRSAKVSEADEGDIEEENPLEALFTELEKENFNHPAVKSYQTFKLAAGKTAKSILISLAVRLNVWLSKDICCLTNNDEMELEKIGTEKTAIFLLLPETDDTFKVIASLFYSQLFKILFYEADYNHNGFLPLLVNVEADEFANIGEIPDFDKYIATMRSRNVRASIVVQALSQLEKLYKDTWEIILGNCFAINYLGTTDTKTQEWVSKRLGKATVFLETKGSSKGRKQSSVSENGQYIARDLMTTDEINQMNKDNSIVFLKGFRPFFTTKYDTAKHPLFNKVGSGKFNPSMCVNIRELFAAKVVENERLYEERLIGMAENMKFNEEQKSLKMQAYELAIKEEMESED